MLLSDMPLFYPVLQHLHAVQLLHLQGVFENMKCQYTMVIFSFVLFLDLKLFRLVPVYPVYLTAAFRKI